MRPVILDLFCCAGGGAEGYTRAGFDVIGVDIVGSARYPGELLVGDALAVVSDPGVLRRVVAIHASPPCQGYTQMPAKHRGQGTLSDTRKRLICAVRTALVRAGKPWVIENVPGARRAMIDPVILTGGQFGLRVHRPPLFESSFPIPSLPTAPPPPDCVGVYGRSPDGRRLWTRADGSELRCVSSVEEGRAAMGISRPLAWREVAEAIPPAYTEHIGRALMASL